MQEAGARFVVIPEGVEEYLPVRSRTWSWAELGEPFWRELEKHAILTEHLRRRGGDIYESGARLRAARQEHPHYFPFILSLEEQEDWSDFWDAASAAFADQPAARLSRLASRWGWKRDAPHADSEGMHQATMCVLFALCALPYRSLYFPTDAERLAAIGVSGAGRSVRVDWDETGVTVSGRTPGGRSFREI